MKIARPSVRHEQISRVFRDARCELPNFLKRVQRTADNLTLLAGEWLDMSCCGSMVEPATPLMDVGLRLAAQALGNLFKIANGNGKPVKVEFLGHIVSLAGQVAEHEVRTQQIGPHEIEHHLFVGPGKVDESTIYASRWIEAYYLCALCREEELVASLCQTPTNLLRRSTTRDQEFRYVLVDAIKAFAMRAGDAESQLLAVLKTIEIGRRSLRKPSWVLLLDKPAVELLLHLQRGDDKAFAAALPRAVKAHKKYWTKTEKRRLDWNGFLSIPLLGISALAYDRGFRFDVESEYLPMRLVRGEFKPCDVDFQAPPAPAPAKPVFCWDPEPIERDEDEEREERLRKALIGMDLGMHIPNFHGKLVYSEEHFEDLDQVYEQNGNFVVVHIRVGTDPGKFLPIPGANLAQAGTRKFLELALYGMIARGGRGEEIARRLDEALKAGKVRCCDFHMELSQEAPGKWKYGDYTIQFCDIS